MLAGLWGSSAWAADGVCVDPANPAIVVGTATGSGNEVACGEGAAASETDAIAVGTQAKARGKYSVALGSGAETGPVDYSMAMGYQSRAMGVSAVAVGPNAKALTGGSVALGQGATTIRSTVNIDPAAGDSNGVAIGNNASARIASSIAIGNGAVTENTLYGSNRPTSSIAIGLNAAAMGDQSIAIGRDTGSTNSNGYQNVAVGIASGQNIQPVQAAANNGVFVNASQNVAYGVSSGNNVTGTNNLALGSSAGNDVGPMTDATSGPGSPYCLFPPFYCYGGGASGGHNTAIGPAAGNTVRGSQNIGIGFRSGSLTTGNNNMAIGQLSGFTVNGSGNVGVGSFSGAYLTGFLNTAVGNTAGQNVTGDRNSAYGNGAGINITGSMNTSLGQAAGQYTTGSNNVALGVIAGRRINGSNNIAIGNNANQSGNAANPVVVSYATAIGDSSRAWGTNTIALGSSTVAGVRNDTTVVDAIAIGNLSWATGNKSVAIGSDSRATGIQSISIGTGNRVTGDNAGAIGDPSYIDGDSAYGIGNNNSITATANESFVLGNNNTVSTGNMFVIGNNVTTTAANSVFLGSASAYVADNDARTQGLDNTYTSATINGVSRNFAGGDQVVGVVSVGNGTQTRRIQNVAPGMIGADSTDAINGSQLFAVQQGLTHYYSVNDDGVPKGNYNNDGATGLHALAAGTRAEATAENATAVGNQASALATNATAIGVQSHADGSGSLAIGSGAHGAGEGSTAIGINSTAGEGDVAIGAGALTNVLPSADGLTPGTTLSGGSNVAVGYFAGQYLQGKDNALFGAMSGQSLVGSENTVAGAYSGHSLAGSFNSGFGSNALAGAVGNRNTATGNYALTQVQGNLNTGAGTYALAGVQGNNNLGNGIGAGALVIGSNNVSVGNLAGTQAVVDANGNPTGFTTTTVSHATSIGNNAKALVNYGTALGDGAVANTSIGDVAIGSGSVTAAPNPTASTTIRGTTYNFAGTTPASVVSVGDVGAERQVTNVAAGRISGTSTDAINGSQLYATNQAVEAISVTAGNTDERAVKYDWVDANGNGVVDPGEVNYTSVTMNPGGEATTIGNVAAGEVSATSTQAINGSQLFEVKQGLTHYYSVNSSGGGNYNNDGATGTDSIAAGKDALASGYNSVAMGTNAKSTGQWGSIAIGGAEVGLSTNVAGRASIALGFGSNANPTLGDARGGTAIGSFSSAGDASYNTAIGYRAAANGGLLGDGTFATSVGAFSNANGTFATALGSGAKAQANQAITIGAFATNAQAGAVLIGTPATTVGGANAVAIGGGAKANNANDVALGSGSVTAAANPTASTTIRGTTYNFAGTAPTSVVSVGAAGAERQVTNVAAGRISGTSTDAINGSQLYATNQAVEAISVTAGNTDERAVKYDWVDANGNGVVDPGEVNYTSVTMNPGGAATTIGNVAAGEVSATSTQAINGSQLHGTAQSIATHLGGGSVVNADGTVSAPAYVTSTGTYNNVGAALVAGNQQTNTLGGSIAAGLGGTSSYDPVTGSVITALNVGGTTYNDVNSALNALNTTASAGWNLQANGGAATNIAPDGSVNVVDGSNTRVTLTGNTLKVDVVDNPTFAGQVTMNGGFVVGANQTVDMGGNVIRNVGAGEVSATSTDAVNGSQLYQTNQAVQAVDNRVTNLSGDVTNLTNRVGANEINISAIQNGAAGMFQVNQPAGAAPAPTGTNAAAGGSDTVASGANSTAVGNQSVASGANSTAYGQGSQASGTGSTALGQGAVATGNSSIAIGSGSTAVADNVVSVGNIGAERRIVNVAPGVNGTDAVNVSQLQGYFAGGVQYDKNADGSVNHNSVTLNPGGTGPTVIHNVGAGVAPTDAVNVGQLNAGLTNTLNQANAYTDARFNDINNDIWTMRRDFRGATASAMAMAGLPQAYLPGKSMLAAGVGGYGGQYGIAVGLSGITENGKWVYKAQASGNTSDDWGFSAGVGIQW